MANQNSNVTRRVAPIILADNVVLASTTDVIPSASSSIDNLSVASLFNNNGPGKINSVVINNAQNYKVSYRESKFEIND